MRPRSPGERRVQFVWWWTGVAVTFLAATVYVLFAPGPVTGMAAGGVYAAVVAAVAAKYDQAWYAIDRISPGGDGR